MAAVALGVKQHPLEDQWCHSFTSAPLSDCWAILTGKSHGPTWRRAKWNSALLKTHTRVHTHRVGEVVRWQWRQWKSPVGVAEWGSICPTVSARSTLTSPRDSGGLIQWAIDWPLDWLVVPLTPSQRWRRLWTTCGCFWLSWLLRATETIDILCPCSLGFVSMMKMMMHSDMVVRVTSKALVVSLSLQEHWVLKVGEWGWKVHKQLQL